MVDSETDDLDIEALYNKAFPPEYLEELKQKTAHTEIVEADDEDDIVRNPICWSPYFVLAKLTDAQRKYNQVPADKAVWNRYFCDSLTKQEMKKFKVSQIRPLNQQQREKIHQKIEDYFLSIEKECPDLKIFLSDKIDLVLLYWHEEANLSGFIFTKDIHLEGSLFQEKANFGLSVFRGKARFDDTVFEENAGFGGSTFKKRAYFDGVFKKEAHFGYCLFDKSAHFGWMKFLSIALFDESVFKKYASFRMSFFAKELSLQNIIFERNVSFSEINCQGRFFLRGSILKKEAFFDKAQFHQNIEVEFCSFNQDVDFTESIFTKNMYIEGTKFKGQVSFARADFKNKTTFLEAVFQEKCVFSEADFESSLCNFKGTVFQKGMNLHKAKYPKKSVPDGVDAETARIAWQTFRQAIKGEDDIQTELMLFSREMDTRIEEIKRQRWSWQFFKNLPVFIMIWLYRLSSDYGRSIARPLILFFGWCVLGFGIIYAWFGWNFASFSPWQLSFYDATGFLSITDKDYYDHLIKEVIGSNEVMRFKIYPVLRNLNKLFALISFALLGLGIRNHLRLK